LIVRARSVWLLGALAAALGLWWYSRTDAGASVVASITNTVGDLLTPRGIRNNNPGNIVRSAIVWQGQLTPDQVAAKGWTWDDTYVQFDDPSNGVRAIGHVLLSKSQRGLNTVDAIISDYSTTDVAAYIANVSAALGVGPDDVVDVGSDLPTFATAIIQQENGQQPYDPANIAQWVYS
jgi:hypothetical protein